MKIAPQLIAVSALVCLFTQCTMTPDQQFIRQKIPIEIQRGEPSTVKIGLSGNGPNEVGIRCTPAVWQTLLDGQDSITVRLESSDGTEIFFVSPGGYKDTYGGREVLFPKGYKLWPVDSFYHIFFIQGPRGAIASVEITFKSAPEGVIHAEIIVLRTPIDTKP